MQLAVVTFEISANRPGFKLNQTYSESCSCLKHDAPIFLFFFDVSPIDRFNASFYFTNVIFVVLLF